MIFSMKQLLLLTAFICTLATSNAQSSAAEAKAAYLLAEEEFSAGKYAASLSYLEQAATKLGGANAKILYLKILALQVLAEDDETSLEGLKIAIGDFVKSPDYASFNEEKQLEVMKIKLRLERENASGKPVNPLAASCYIKFGLAGWQLGAKLEDMKAAHPEFFLKAVKTAPNDTLAFYQSSGAQNTMVLVSNGVVTGITKVLLSNVKDDASFSQGRNNLLDVKNYLGGNPVESPPYRNDSPPSKWATISTTATGYTWTDKRVTANATLVSTKTKKYKQPDTYESYFTVGVYYQPR